MLANHKLARAISDVGFGMFRSQIEYRTRLIIADRWYPSSRLCSVCGYKNDALALSLHHDRHLNAALNLKRLATATALPVASPSGNGGTVVEGISITVGEVTPVRYECSLQDASGQEKNGAHVCALS
ncbi:transposase [uncultured Thermosynechococcus sp.]|uniref:transposase n=1 Tax=uncultured Thermosynechococcus sp. TaxID=436945 RepID=UPI0026362471|nr:transposase [uncultured Thermosynechococcus sp.]